MKHDNKQQLNISEADIDYAWERFMEKTKDEPASEFWSNILNMEISQQSQHEPEPVTQKEQHNMHDQPAIQKGNLSFAQEGMIRRLRRNRMTKRWLSLGLSALVAGLVLFSPWGQTVMASMLNTFRVQHLETVSISDAELNTFREAIKQGTSGVNHLDLKRYGEIEQRGEGQARVVDQAEADQIAGQPLKTLPGVASVQVTYQPEQKLIFKLYTKEINTLIKLLGGLTAFPDSVNKKPIELALSKAFVMQASQSEANPSSSGKMLSQFPAPSLEVPEGVDLEQVRQAVLDLPLMPESIRSQLAAIGDWRDTLPIPSVAGDHNRLISVAGQEGIINMTGQRRSFIWLQDGWVFELSGSMVDYPSEESLINEAKGLIQS